MLGGSCDIDEFVVFSLAVRDKSDVIVRTTVKNLSTGKESSFYLTIKGNELYVGRNECSGPFTFLDEGKYDLVVSLVDASGNISDYEDRPVRFTFW